MSVLQASNAFRVGAGLAVGVGAGLAVGVGRAIWGLLDLAVAFRQTLVLPLFMQTNSWPLWV